MKRLIKASQFKPIDSWKFAHELRDCLKQNMPKICRMSTNSYCNEITVTHCSSLNKLRNATIKSLKLLGYEVDTPDTVDCEVAAIQYPAFVAVNFNFYEDEDDDEGNTGYIDLGYLFGSVEDQEWYRG